MKSEILIGHIGIFRNKHVGFINKFIKGVIEEHIGIAGEHNISV